MSDGLKKQLPNFANEAEEAAWWYENREELGEEFVQAMREGRVTPRGHDAPGIGAYPQDHDSFARLRGRQGFS